MHPSPAVVELPPPVTSSDVGFRAVFDEALDAMVLVDDAGRYIDANPVACRMLGATRERLLRASIYDLGDDPAAVRDAMAELLARGTLRGDWTVDLPGEGRRIWHFVSRANVLPGTHLSILRDVTAERAAAVELRRSQGMFAAAFSASPVAMAVVCASDGRILALNDSAVALVGDTRERLVGSAFRTSDLWVDAGARKQLGKALYAHGSIRDFRARMRRSDGEIRHVVVAVEPLEVDGHACRLVVANDITTQFATQQMLEDTQRVGGIGGWSVDLRTAAVTWSSESSRLAGRSEPPRDLGALLELVHPDDRARSRAGVHDAIFEGRPYDVEKRFLRPDGEVRWVHTRATCEEDAQGRPLRLIGTVQDVTERRRVEADLHRSQELFATAFRASPIGISIIDAQRRIVDANEAAVQLMGLTREQLVGADLDALTRFTTTADRQHICRELAQRGEVRNVRTQILRTDDEARDVVLSIHRIEVGGEPCMLVVTNDITEQCQTERDLEEAQSLGHVGSWSCDFATERIAWSRETCKIFGVSETARATYQDWLQRVDPEDLAGITAARRRARAGDGTYEHEYRIIRPDGERRWVQTRGRVVTNPDGQIVRMYGTVRDVTTAHEAAAALSASEERYRRIVETSSQGVATMLPDGTLTFVNRRAADMVGLTPEQLVGRNMADFLEPGANLELAAMRSRRRAGNTDTYDLTLVGANGARLRVEITASPLTRATGEWEGSLVMISDVTLRRQAEELRSRLAAIVESSRDAISSCSLDGTIQTWNAAAVRLFGYCADEVIGKNHAMLVPADHSAGYEADVARVLRGEVVTMEATRRRHDGTRVELALTRSPVCDATGAVVAISTIARDISAQKRLESSLRDTEAQLRQAQKMEAIGALAGGIAHDFNNILSVVLGCATMIEEALDPADPICEDAREIREAAERAVTLTRQLLAFSRRQVLEPRVVNLEKVIAGMEKMLRRLIGQRIELVVGGGSTANVLIDPSQFEQVILNLAVNARDAMPGGGQLAIDCEQIVITADEAAARGTRPGAYVCVRVADTGTGMDEDTRARMFEPFFTTKEKGKGTGLGLATVFGIVRQSGGFLQVDSEPGRGTRFAIEIPVVEGSEETAPVAAPPAVLHTRGETVLVVDDEEPVARLVQQFLRRQGYEVLLATNAGEALLLAEQRARIDMLVTDVVMPIVNGRQLAERLQKSRPELPVVFMSGYHDDVALRDMLGSAGVAYLQKPIQREQLLRKVRELLDAR